MSEVKSSGLALLREEFKPNQISKLPKGTKAQNECKSEEKKNCKVCGGLHHPNIIHLDYVGHAALTDRLLDADPLWYWEPLAFKDGLPAFDATGGLWIRLYVCGHSRIGYGHAQASSFKEIGSREKEVIGDALRNAAMRFGAALDLWHKGDLHVDDVASSTVNESKSEAVEDYEKVNATDIAAIRQALLIAGKEEDKALSFWKLASIDLMPKSWVQKILEQLKPKVANNETV